MIFVLNLIKIEIKRVLRFLPHILVGALALCFIIGIISYSASKILYEKENRNKINIAISIPKDENSARLLISIIKDMKSVKENCNFIEVNDEEDAYEKVENGGAYGAIIIPKHFVRDILDGTNTPATVLLPNKSSIESMLIKDLIDGGTQSLASAQAGIYAVSYEYEQTYHERLTKALQDNINIKYMDHTLQRENYFNHIKLSATGELTTIEYYICSGIILFMLLLGMSFSKYLSPSNRCFYEKLRPCGIKNITLIFSRVISVFTVYVIIVSIMFLVYVGVCKYSNNNIIDLNSFDCVSMLFVILCIANFIVCIFTAVESQISGTLFLFIITISMNFISGGFLPTAFLPKAMQSLAPYMLTNALSKQVGNIFLQKFEMKELLSALVVIVVINIITIAIVTIKEKLYFINNINFSGNNEMVNNLKELFKKKVGK